MTILQETVKASYAGIPFLVMQSRINGGTKDVIHEYPNSNRQNVESLGAKVRGYTMLLSTHADPDGNNYKQKRNLLLQALESGVANVLIHPLYGRIDNVKVRSYEVLEDYGRLGEAEFSVTFAIDNSEGTQVVDEDSLSLVDDSIEDSISEVFVYASNNFFVSKIFPSNFTDAVKKVNDVIDSFEENTSLLQANADRIDEFSAELIKLRSNVATLVASPNDLINSINDLFRIVNDLYTIPTSTLNVLERFYDFGSEDEETPITQNTASRVERARNRQVLNDVIRSESLALNYGNASLIEYSTLDELEQATSTLETQYQVVKSNSGLTTTALNKLADTRTITQRFFDDAKLNIRQVIEVKTVSIPARLLAYQYYGSSNLGSDIANLNQDMNVSSLEGSVKVFAE